MYISIFCATSDVKIQVIHINLLCAIYTVCSVYFNFTTAVRLKSGQTIDYTITSEVIVLTQRGLQLGM